MNETGFGLIMSGMVLWFAAVAWWNPLPSWILTACGAVALVIGVALFSASVAHRPHE